MRIEEMRVRNERETIRKLRIRHENDVMRY